MESSAPLAAKRLFKYISGVLNAAYPLSYASKCGNDVPVFLPEVDISFESACDALSVAIQQNQVPQQGLDVLKNLIGKPATKSETKHVSDRLRRALGLPSLLPSLSETDDVANGTDHATNGDHSPVIVGHRAYMSSHSKMRLLIRDCAQLDELDPSFPLRDVLVGVDNANLDFISKETGVLLALDEEDGDLFFAPTSQDTKVTRDKLDKAFQLAKDLIQDVTTSRHDAWKNEQKMADDRRLEEEKGAEEERQRKAEVARKFEGRLEVEKIVAEEKIVPDEKSAKAASVKEASKRTDANNLFRFVTGALSGEKLPPQAYTVITKIVASFEGCEPHEVAKDDLVRGASRLLAQCVKAKEVPQQGIDVLLGLRAQMAAEGTDELDESLQDFTREFSS